MLALASCELTDAALSSRRMCLLQSYCASASEGPGAASIPPLAGPARGCIRAAMRQSLHTLLIDLAEERRTPGRRRQRESGDCTSATRRTRLHALLIVHAEKRRTRHRRSERDPGEPRRTWQAARPSRCGLTACQMST